MILDRQINYQNKFDEKQVQSASFLTRRHSKLRQKTSCLLQHHIIIPLLILMLLLFPLPLLLLLRMYLQLLIQLHIQFLNIHLTVLLIKSQSNIDNFYYIHILQLLNSRQNITKLLFYYSLFTVFENTDTTTVEEKVTLVTVERQHHVPQLHCLVKTELLSQK